MCLSVPGQIVKFEGDQGTVSIGGSQVEVNLSLIDGIEIGDYVLVHTGFALQKISEEEAIETFKTIKLYEESLEDEDKQMS